MPRDVTYETYAPVLFGDAQFIPAVTTLVRAHLDENMPRLGVVSRTNDRLMPLVSNRAVVFEDPRYIFGRLMVPDVKHNSSKLRSIRESMNARGSYSKYSGEFLGVLLDTVRSIEIQTQQGPETLIVVCSSKDDKESPNFEPTEISDYTDEIVEATNRLIAKRKSIAITGEKFNTLNKTTPIVSLGTIASSGVDVELLVKNIEELVEVPMQSVVAFPEDGIVTRISS